MRRAPELISPARLLAGRDRDRLRAAGRAQRQRLRGRFEASAAKQRATRAEREAAEQVRSLREELAAAVGEVSACAGCAAGMELPEGACSGGRCCAGATEDVFHPEEVDLLTLLGVEASELRGPDDPATRGCGFRGETGCSLEPRARPTICIHYICRELFAELHQREPAASARAGALQDELAVAMREYNSARADRIADDEIAELIEAATRAR